MATWFYKWFFILMLPSGLYVSEKTNKQKALSDWHIGQYHPLHVSVTEINHNAVDKTLEISCKLFTDDFEKVLAHNYKTKIDLISPADRPAMEKFVNDFIHRHLTIKTDGKPVQFSFLGYEKENDVIYSYFQADSSGTIKKIEITNTILHELFTDEINLMHVIVGGKRKSMKLDYPDKEASFSF